MKNPLCSNLRIALMCAIALVGPAALAQSALNVEAALEGMTAADPTVRMIAYSNLMQPMGGVYGGPTNLLKPSPDLPDRIKLALIDLLATEAALSEKFNNTPRPDVPAGFSEYFAELGYTVGRLRDPRAIKALLYGLREGAGDLALMAELCPSSVDALLENATDPDQRFAGLVIHELGLCLQRPVALKADPAAAAKIRKALVSALHNPDWFVRRSAVYALKSLRADPEVRQELGYIAGADTYVSKAERQGESINRFEVREAAQMILAAPAELNFFVMRDPDTKECKVQSGDAATDWERFMGPDRDQFVREGMCANLDRSGKDPMRCWLVAPKDACGRGQ